MSVKVAINGYGTIGKRVADAIAVQDDMEVVGVTKRRPTYEARMAVKNGFAFYAADEEFIKGFEEENIPVQGTLKDLLGKVDIVVDGTPKKCGYLPMYEEAKVKAKTEAEAKVKEKEELQALRYKRTLEREKHEAERKAREGEKITKTAASVQLDLVERLTQNLERIHKR